MGETEKFSKRGKKFHREIILPKAMAERSSRQRRERGAVPKAQATTRGVRGHAPPEKFWIPDANLCNLVPSDQLFYSFFTFYFSSTISQFSRTFKYQIVIFKYIFHFQGLNFFSSTFKDFQGPVGTLYTALPIPF